MDARQFSRTLCTFICAKRIPVTAKRDAVAYSARNPQNSPHDDGIDRAEKHGKAEGDGMALGPSFSLP